MNNHEALIRSVLGDKVEDVTLTAADQRWQGWERRAAPERCLVSECEKYNAEREILTHLVEQFWLSFHHLNIRLWSNFGWNILAVPEMPVLEILKYEEVGMHYVSDKSMPMQETHEALAFIYSQCPFAILFANTNGLRAVFLEPVSERQASEFEDLIFTISEGYSALPQEYQNQVDEQGILQMPSMAEYILKEQRFLLWWD